MSHVAGPTTARHSMLGWNPSSYSLQDVAKMMLWECIQGRYRVPIV